MSVLYVLFWNVAQLFSCDAFCFVNFLFFFFPTSSPSLFKGVKISRKKYENPHLFLAQKTREIGGKKMKIPQKTKMMLKKLWKFPQKNFTSTRGEWRKMLLQSSHRAVLNK